jgi:hypothetical protein
MKAVYSLPGSPTVPCDDRGQRRGFERRDQNQVDLLGDEIVHLRGLGIHVAGAVGDLQRELRNLLGRRGQFVVDVLTVGLGVVGLREADDVIAVLAAVLDGGGCVRRADGERKRSDAQHQRCGSFRYYKGHESLPWVVHVRMLPTAVGVRSRRCMGHFRELVVAPPWFQRPNPSRRRTRD